MCIALASRVAFKEKGGKYLSRLHIPASSGRLKEMSCVLILHVCNTYSNSKCFCRRVDNNFRHICVVSAKNQAFIRLKEARFQRI